MKAAVVIQEGRLEVMDLPVPEVGEYDVLCNIEYGATCAGTDIHLMQGKHPNPVYFPTILGHESVGRVIEIGKKVKNFKIGDLVSRVGAPPGLIDGLNANWGGFAQYGIARDHWQMKRNGELKERWEKFRVNQIIPDVIDVRTAPMIITWRETLSYLKRLGVTAGKNVLVLGFGANAVSLAAHACNKGAFVAQTGNISRKDTSIAVGVRRYIDYKAKDGPEQARNFCPEGYDFIIDSVGTTVGMNNMLPLLKKGGMIGVYGWNERHNYGINPFKAKSSFGVYSDGYDEEEAHGEVVGNILSGKLDASLWYDMEHPIPLDKIASAYDSLSRHEALKYLIEL